MQQNAIQILYQYFLRNMKIQVYFQDKNPKPLKSSIRKNRGNKGNHHFYEKFLFKSLFNFYSAFVA